MAPGTWKKTVGKLGSFIHMGVMSIKMLGGRDWKRMKYRKSQDYWKFKDRCVSKVIHGASVIFEASSTTSLSCKDP